MTLKFLIHIEKGFHPVLYMRQAVLWKLEVKDQHIPKGGDEYDLDF